MDHREKQNKSRPHRYTRCCYTTTHGVQLFTQLIGGVALFLPPLIHNVIAHILVVAVILFVIAVPGRLVVTLTLLFHGLHGALNFLLTKTDNKGKQHQVSLHYHYY